MHMKSRGQGIKPRATFDQIWREEEKGLVTFGETTLSKKLCKVEFYHLQSMISIRLIQLLYETFSWQGERGVNAEKNMEFFQL